MTVLDLKREARRVSTAMIRSALMYCETVGRPSADVKVLHYCFRNWGDAINPALVEFISGQRVQSVDIDARSLLPLPRDPAASTLFAVVGSIVHHADSQTVIWGAGLQDKDTPLRQPPKAIHAVRGPLTAAELNRQGIPCDDVYGDPVLLLPRYYRPEARKRYRLGIIPHFSDQVHPALQRFAERDDVKLIDIRGPLWGTVNAVCECEHIVSTSLHGLILADAYGIPSAWGQLGDEVPGGRFKFLDYYLSIGEGPVEPTTSLLDGSVSTLCRESAHRPIRLDLDRLLEACPFRWSELSEPQQLARHASA